MILSHRVLSFAIALTAVSQICFVSFADGVSTVLDSSLIKTDGSPAYGHFYGWQTSTNGPRNAFKQAYDKSLADQVPLVVIWSAEGCNHCSGFAANLNDEKDILLGWMAQRKAIFTYFKGYSPEAPGETALAYNFIVDTCGLAAGYTAWPYYAIYYRDSNGGTHIDKGSFALDTFSVGSYGAWSMASFTNRCDVMFRAWGVPDDGVVKPDPSPVPGAASFGCGAKETARLESMPSTKTIYVPLQKTANLSLCTTNVMEVFYPNSETVSKSVVWPAVAGTSATMEVPVDVSTCNTPGNIISLRLYDDTGALNATNLITCVAEAEPSPQFPLWLGERTVDTLDWGDWTFDFDTATNKVRRAAEHGTNSWTLVVIGGGLWCPNCMSCETYLTGDSRFAAWAKSKNLALVVSDQPQMGTTKSSMMTHEIGTGGRSGSYYLSRKGLTAAEGMAQFMAMTNRSYRLWKVNPEAVRVANPTFILFRPDGRIAGRLDGAHQSRIAEPGVASSNEKFSFEENIARLDELLAVGEDATEESNNRPATTSLPAYEFGDTRRCSLSIADTEDVFPFEKIPVGVPFRVTVTTNETAKSAGMARLLTVTDKSTGAYTEIPSLIEGENAWRLTQAQVEAGVYIEISSFADRRYATYGRGTAMTAVFSTAEMSNDPGVVGFAVAEAEVHEQDRKVELQLVRKRGSTGEIGVRVVLDAEKTTAPDWSYKWDAADESAHTVYWGDFEYGTKTLTVPIVDDKEFTGDRTLAFSIAPLGESGVEIGETNILVTVREDEELLPGKLEISSTAPAAVQGLVVDVPAGGSLTLSIRRTGGSLGEAATAFAVSHEGVSASTNRLAWGDGDAGTRTVVFKLPSIAYFAENPLFTVSLDPEDGTSVVASKSRITVRVAEADKARFNNEISDCIETVQNFLFEEIFTLDDPRFDKDSRVVVGNGKIPRGLDVTWDGEELTVSGSVRDAGDHSVTLWLESSTTGETTLPVNIAISAAPIGEFSELLAVSHDYRSLPVITAAGDGNDAFVTGSLDVTIPVSGRISARYRKFDGTTTVFAFDGWSGLDAEGNIYAEAYGRDSSASCCGVVASRPSLRIATSDDGTFDIELSDPAFGKVALTHQKCRPWSYDSSANAWQGVYTAGFIPRNTDSPLCTGSASLACRMTQGAASSGRMTLAGVLPNGTLFSGTACVFRDDGGDEPTVVLPIFNATANDAFSALAIIRTEGSMRRTVVRGDAAAVPVWRHTEAGAPKLSYVQTFDAYGSWFNPRENWRTLLRNYYLKQSLPILIESGGSVLSATVTTESETNLVISATADNDSGITLEVNYATGQIRGAFTAEDPGGVLRSASYRGVLTPGWLEGCDCGGSPAASESVVRPFAIGAWWWIEKARYTDEEGQPRSKSVKTGGSVTIENIND